jgi:hypothetical protein
MRRARQIAAALLFSTIAAPAAGCAGAVDRNPLEPDNRTVRVNGRLTDEGVECPALRGDDGRLYTLAGDLKGFKPGDRVVVEGTVAEASFCMQGTTLEVKSIQRQNE